MHEGKYYLLMGRHRVNHQEYSSHEEVIDYVTQNTLNVALQMMFIVNYDIEEQNRKSENKH